MERAKWNKTDKLADSSSGWADNSVKTGNKGKIDPYRSKQSQLSSNVFESATDYKSFEPMNKKEQNMNFNDMQSHKVKTDPKKPKTDINVNVKDKKEHVYSNAKQSQLASAFDAERDFVPSYPQPVEQASPVKSSKETQKKKLQNLTTNTNLPGYDANKFYHQSQNTGEVLDLVLTGLKENH